MAGKITTGLGSNVDAFVSKSPALAQMLAQAKKRWPQDFKIEAGDHFSSSYRKITLNSKETPLEQALGLAHELGHLLNTRGTIPGGKSFQEFVSRNTDAQISEEEAAVRAEIQVRNELRQSGIKIPHLVLDAIIDGKKIPYDVEALIKNPAQFKSLFPYVITEVTSGDPMRIYWPNYFGTKAWQGIYKGYKPQVPKINLKRPGSSSLINIQDFLVPKVAGGEAVSGLSQFGAWQQQNQINQWHLGQQQAQQHIQEAQLHTQEMWEAQRRVQREALRRMQEEAQRRAQREALRRMQEEAQRRAQEQQREAQRRAQEEAQRRAQEQQREMLRKQLAIQAASIKRPPIDILRPTYWGPGPHYTGTIIAGPPLNPSRPLSGGPIGPGIWPPKHP